MQESPVYAVRKHVLIQAENTIVDLEKALNLALEELKRYKTH